MAIRKPLTPSKANRHPSTHKIMDEARGKSKRRYPPKKCKYCHGMFVPFQEHQEFCTPSHRKMFWKHGSMPYEKLALKLEARLRVMLDAELAPLRARIDKLESWATLSASIGTPHDEFPIKAWSAAGSERTA